MRGCVVMERRLEPALQAPIPCPGHVPSQDLPLGVLEAQLAVDICAPWVGATEGRSLIGESRTRRRRPRRRSADRFEYGQKPIEVRQGVLHPIRLGKGQLEIAARQTEAARLEGLGEHLALAQPTQWSQVGAVVAGLGDMSQDLAWLGEALLHPDRVLEGAVAAWSVCDPESSGHDHPNPPERL